MSYGPPRGTQVNSRLRVGVASAAALQINRNLPFAQTETRGPGFLAGEPPHGGTITGDGIPVSATVRILLRGVAGHPSDGMVVREVVSAPSGAWLVDNLNPDLRYDAVGRKTGYADVMVSNLKPMRTDLMELVQNTLEENAHNGLDGFVEFVGGLPPYTHSIVGTTPPGLTVVFDRRRLSFAGTSAETGTWEFDVVFSSGNGLELVVPLAVEFTVAPDPYWVAVLSLLSLEGPNNGTSISDKKGRAWAPSGQAKLSTDQAKFGGSSLFLDGTSNTYVTTANTTDFQFGSGNLTIEMFVRPASAGMLVASWRGFVANICSWLVKRTPVGQLGFRYGVAGVNNEFLSTATIPLNVWTHVAVVRNGTSILLFVNGVLDSTHTLVGELNYYANEPVVIGAYHVTADSAGGDRYTGYIDEMRITKGVARYTSSFTPPDRVFPDF